MSRAGVGARSHSRDVRRFEDEESRGRSAAAARGDIDDDGDGRVHDLLDDFSGGLHQAAGCVDLDQECLVILNFRLRQGATDEFVCDGLDGVVHDDLEHVGAGQPGCKQEYQQRRGGSELSGTSPAEFLEGAPKQDCALSKRRFHQFGSGCAFCASLAATALQP